MKHTTTARGLMASALLFAIFSVQSCKKQTVQPSSNLADGSQNTTNVITPCGEPVVTSLMAGQNIDAGAITVQNTEDSLFVTFSTDGGWVLGKTHLYVGLLEDMPSTSGGNPQIGNFPYQHTINPYTTSDQYAIALSDLPNCFIVATHAEVHLLGSNGEVVDSQTGWGQGNQMNESGSWAMYSSYCVQECSPCEFVTESFDLFAGQTIDVGDLLVTNDEENLYITYQATGDWFVGKVHVYVGAIDGLPVNGANVPIPGQFPYSEAYNPYTQTATVTVPLTGLPTCYVIAAHAEMHRVVNGEEVQEETGWSFGTPFADTDRWGWTSPYCTQICE